MRKSLSAFVNESTIHDNAVHSTLRKLDEIIGEFHRIEIPLEKADYAALLEKVKHLTGMMKELGEKQKKAIAKPKILKINSDRLNHWVDELNKTFSMGFTIREPEEDARRAPEKWKLFRQKVEQYKRQVDELLKLLENEVATKRINADTLLQIATQFAKYLNSEDKRTTKRMLTVIRQRFDNIIRAMYSSSAMGGNILSQL